MLKVVPELVAVDGGVVAETCHQGHSLQVNLVNRYRYSLTDKPLNSLLPRGGIHYWVPKYKDPDPNPGSDLVFKRLNGKIIFSN